MLAGLDSILRLRGTTSLCFQLRSHLQSLPHWPLSLSAKPVLLQTWPFFCLHSCLWWKSGKSPWSWIFIGCPNTIPSATRSWTLTRTTKSHLPCKVTHLQIPEVSTWVSLETIILQSMRAWYHFLQCLAYTLHLIVSCDSAAAILWRV